MSIVKVKSIKGLTGTFIFKYFEDNSRKYVDVFKDGTYKRRHKVVRKISEGVKK